MLDKQSKEAFPIRQAISHYKTSECESLLIIHMTTNESLDCIRPMRKAAIIAPFNKPSSAGKFQLKIVGLHYFLIKANLLGVRCRFVCDDVMFVCDDVIVYGNGLCMCTPCCRQDFPESWCLCACTQCASLSIKGRGN